MKKQFLLLAIILFSTIIYFTSENTKKLDDTSITNITGVVTNSLNKEITLQTEDGNYNFNLKNEVPLGSKITINCLGNTLSNCEVIDYKIITENYIPKDYLDNGLFSDYYLLAFQKLKTMNLSEKISQTLLVHYNDNITNEQKKYQFGGFIFFEKDFKNKTKDEVFNMINDLQNASKIPILSAVDEEGGTVTRISYNKNLVAEPFKSPQELYKEGGFSLIKEDVINKSKILSELGLNLNLAPVVDVSTNKNDYIYKRTLGLDTFEVSKYAKVVIETSKNTQVSYTLKHFSGYGSNGDTHKKSSIEEKSYEDILKYDLPPFISGIESGAEAIMNSHNIIKSIDPENPASLSKKVHEILRNDLHFTGIIITDDLNMQALKNIDNKEIKALLAGNNILITADYKESYNNILDGINNKLLTEEELDKIVFKIIAWKYYKHLL